MDVISCASHPRLAPSTGSIHAVTLHHGLASQTRSGSVATLHVGLACQTPHSGSGHGVTMCWIIYVPEHSGTWDHVIQPMGSPWVQKLDCGGVVVALVATALEVRAANTATASLVLNFQA